MREAWKKFRASWPHVDLLDYHTLPGKAVICGFIIFAAFKKVSSQPLSDYWPLRLMSIFTVIHWASNLIIKMIITTFSSYSVIFPGSAFFITNVFVKYILQSWIRGNTEDDYKLRFLCQLVYLIAYGTNFFKLGIEYPPLFAVTYIYRVLLQSITN